MATDYHEGDMALALVDYWMHNMCVQELLDLARKQLTSDLDELSGSEIRKLYGALVGQEENHESTD